jgi:hypothetical protein
MLAQALRKTKRKEAMPKPDPRTDPPAEFVRKALDRTWAERDSIARWSGRARWWAAVAIVATGAALAFAFVADYQGWGAEHEVKGVVALSRGGAAAIWAVCDPGKLKKPPSKVKAKQPPVGAKLRQTDVAYERDANATVRSTSTTGVYAWVRPSTLDEAIVKVRFDKKECQPDEETVRLRKSQIRAFETP